jgi:uncharacterized protein (TIRG00374 family)
MKNISKNIIYGIALAVVVYIIISIWGARNGLLLSFSNFDWRYLPLLLLIAFSNYMTRFIKWQYYLKILKIKVPFFDSLIIFLSGFSLTITPGKMGEVVKSFFLKIGFNAPISRTAPIVFADRITDLMAFLLIAAVGAYGFSYGQNAIWVIFLVVLGIIILILVRPIGLSLLSFLSKIKFVSKYASRATELYETSYSLLLPKRILFPLAVSLVAWSFEALDFYFILVLMHLNVSAFAAFFVYCFSTIIGAVVMLPGGLGVTDGSIAGLLKYLSIDTGAAAFATILIRAVTLWFAVAIGIVALLIAEKRYVGKPKNENKKSKATNGKIRMLFHVHTNVSEDGRLESEDIISYCRDNKIDVVAITDHNEIDGAFRVQQMAKGNPRVIIGEEIKTLDGEIIGLFLKRKIEKGATLKKTVEQIKKQGGLVCLPHGGDFVRRSAVERGLSETMIANFDIIESFNCRNLFSTTNKFGEYLAKKYDKPKVAGGDIHLKIELPKSINIIKDFKNKSEFLNSLVTTEYYGEKTHFFIQAWCYILKKLK